MKKTIVYILAIIISVGKYSFATVPEIGIDATEFIDTKKESVDYRQLAVDIIHNANQSSRRTLTVEENNWLKKYYGINPQVLSFAKTLMEFSVIHINKNPWNPGHITLIYQTFTEDGRRNIAIIEELLKIRFPKVLQGIQGEKGDRGERGDRGEVGQTGHRGIKGEVGIEGKPGSVPNMDNVIISLNKLNEYIQDISHQGIVPGVSAAPVMSQNLARTYIQKQPNFLESLLLSAVPAGVGGYFYYKGMKALRPPTTTISNNSNQTGGTQTSNLSGSPVNLTANGGTGGSNTNSNIDNGGTGTGGTGGSVGQISNTNQNANNNVNGNTVAVNTGDEGQANGTTSGSGASNQDAETTQD